MGAATSRHASMQTNIVKVGESPGTDLAITVTGLKPNHFYNIRVVALGPNNFQAASQTVRLRTFDKNGKPFLGNARLPTNFVDDDQSKPRGGDDCNGTGPAACSFAASIELLDGNTTKDGNTAPGQRRNTINRRQHSPSVASADQPKQSDLDGPEQSLDELSGQFQDIRREINDTMNQKSIEESENLQAEEELKKEKESKRQSLKEKEEATMSLKGSVRTTMEAMRAAEKEKAKKESQMKDKEAKKTKVRDNITKLEKEMERMKTERESFKEQKAELEKKRDGDVADLDEKIAKLQDDHNELEADLSNKGKQLNEMKEARKHLPGADDDQVKESDDKARREWESTRSSLHHQLIEETRAGQHLDQQLGMIGEQINLQTAQANFFGQSEALGDMEHGPPMQQQKRLSDQSDEGHMSPPGGFAMTDSPSQQPSGQVRSTGGFQPMLFLHPSAEPPTEEDIKSSMGPLSPSAQLYLPSGIIDNESDAKSPQTPMLPEAVDAGEEDPQSPASSNRSFSVLSSPHSSTFNLPFPQYQDNSDRTSANFPPPTNRLASFLGLQRSRTAKPDEESGPPIGSLKPGQSQSFPRGTDENDVLAARRRMSFSFKGHRNSTGPEGSAGSPFAAGRSLLGRRLNPFSSHALFDRDLDDGRPASIASSDLPRPSTDSGSIWGPAGDATFSKSRLWSPGEGKGWGPSRQGSRRPSIHGSPSALTTTLASADDEILYDTELNDPQTLPSQVGVIGSRPPGASAKTLSQRLNPAAPTFMGLFRRDKDDSSEKDKGKGKEKAKDKKDKGKFKEPRASLEIPSADDSPSDSRMSRDTFSVHTQTSVSESHESLPLDASSSNPQLDITPASDSVNGIKRLLRKGSSSKFSLSSRLGKDSSLFKKGPGSATNSDKTMSIDQRSSIGDLDELNEDVADPMSREKDALGKSYDSVTSSPGLGPAKSKEMMAGAKERLPSWGGRFGMKKKATQAQTPGKEKESLDLDRTEE